MHVDPYRNALSAALERLEHQAREAAVLRAGLVPVRPGRVQRTVRSALVGLIVLCGMGIVWVFWAAGP
jgi:hypothetical protein